MINKIKRANEIFYLANRLNRLGFNFIINSIYILVLSFAINLHADNFEGTVTINNSTDYGFKPINSKQVFTITSENYEVLKQFHRLSEGDFISFTASYNVNLKNNLNISSINYVGLFALQGLWKSDDYLCYEFVGFTTFYVYPANILNQCMISSQVRSIPNFLNPYTQKYTYVIDPSILTIEAESWTMLISSNTKDYFGELKVVNSNRLEIRLSDSETGSILRTIILRR